MQVLDQSEIDAVDGGYIGSVVFGSGALGAARGAAVLYLIQREYRKSLV